MVIAVNEIPKLDSTNLTTVSDITASAVTVIVCSNGSVLDVVDHRYGFCIHRICGLILEFQLFLYSSLSFFPSNIELSAGQLLQKEWPVNWLVQSRMKLEIDKLHPVCGLYNAGNPDFLHQSVEGHLD